MNNPKLATKLQSLCVPLIRSARNIRGVGRLTKHLNQALLLAGVEPVQESRMLDGSKMLIDLRSLTERWAFYSGSYDDELICLIQQLLVQWPGNFLDVGGNIGMYAVRVPYSGSNQQFCICFEPMPANASRIRENAALNDLSKLVDVHQIALSDRDGVTELVLREDFEMGASTGNASISISESADTGFRTVKVDLKTFDEVLADLGNISFPICKVDIEGHEDFFLRGAARYLQEQRPVVITEINNWFFEQRGTTSSAEFLTSLPCDYIVLLLQKNRDQFSAKLVDFIALSGLQGINNCLLCPSEKYVQILRILNSLVVPRY